MQYAIIGSGNIGAAVAAHFARTGVPVAVATSRGPSAVAPLIEKLGPSIVAADAADALQSEVVVLATPFEAVQALVESVPDWNQRIIVDATNAIDYSNFSPADLGGRASSDIVEQWARNSRVVKAFGHTWAKVLARDPGDGYGGRRVQFVSGNHPTANAAIAELLQSFGFQTIDPGAQRPGWPAATVRRAADVAEFHLTGAGRCDAPGDGFGCGLTGRGPGGYQSKWRSTSIRLVSVARFRDTNSSKSKGMDSPLRSPSIIAWRSARNRVSRSSRSRSAVRASSKLNDVFLPMR